MSNSISNIGPAKALSSFLKSPQTPHVLQQVERTNAEVSQGTTQMQFLASQEGLRFYERGSRLGQDPNPTPAPPPNGTSVGGTNFEIGPPSRPEINHDNGFLQNPNDRSDPNPIPTREPTKDEIAYYLEEVAKAEAGGVIRRIPGLGRFVERANLDNAIPAYQHFLTGGGDDRNFNYADFLKNDASGQTVRESALSDVRTAGDRLAGDVVDQLGTEPGDQITLEVQSEAFTVGSSARFPYPETEDWQKAIGGHSAWTSSEITLTRLEDGRILAEADVTINAEDRYNFNPGQADIETGVPDSERGVLEESGLAQQYTQTGQADFETSWIIGSPGSTVDPGDHVSGR